MLRCSSWSSTVLAAALALACSPKSSSPERSPDPGINSQVGKRPLDPEQLQQFATPLPIIPARAPDTTTFPGKDYYVVTARQGVHDFGLRDDDGSLILDPATGKPIQTLAWGYDTSYLGPTIEARSGRPVVVKFVNGLQDEKGRPLTRHLLYVDRTLDGAAAEPQVRLVPHLHGGHVAAEFDGNPRFWFTPDPAAPSNGAGGPAGNSVQYTYDNDQPASTIWFHDHALGATRLNVYAGLAAYYLIRDPVEDGLGLPSGEYEIPLVLQDKAFNDDGSLAYQTYPLVNPYTGLQLVDPNGNAMYSSGPETFGNVNLVNGVAWPVLEVEPRRYRFRMVNGADSRFYGLWLEVAGEGPQPGLELVQIGAEQGLLPSSVVAGTGPGTDGLLLANGERADVIVDFAGFAGKTIVLRNGARTPFPDGDEVSALTTGRVMAFRVAASASAPDTSTVPAHPKPLDPLPEPDRTRVVDLQELTDVYALRDPETNAAIPRLELRLNGLRFMDPPTEMPKLGTVEDWIIVNTTVDMHPMHLHLVAFEVKEKGSFDPTRYTPASGGLMGVLAPEALAPGVAPADCLANPDCDASAYEISDAERGLKDTVRVPPGGYVRIRARFDRPGEYMWHCHILSHEEHDMMRPFVVVP
jgi:spore coat protein A, manganese oxidase